MFGFRRRNAEEDSRVQALLQLYRFCIGENSAEAKGRRLLRQWLSPAQREQFDRQGYFDVVGCDTGKRYRIHYGVAANVLEIDGDDAPVAGLCFVPKGHLVPGDVMLAQKIALETSETDARTTANPFPPRRPTAHQPARRPF